MAFKKGQSGNPKGRPVMPEDLRKAAQDLSMEALDTLAKWMRSDQTNASVKACVAVLDRGYGKPAQPVDIDVSAVVSKVIRAPAVQMDSAAWLKTYADQGDSVSATLAGRLNKTMDNNAHLKGRLRSMGLDPED